MFEMHADESEISKWRLRQVISDRFFDGEE